MSRNSQVGFSMSSCVHSAEAGKSKSGRSGAASIGCGSTSSFAMPMPSPSLCTFSMISWRNWKCNHCTIQQLGLPDPSFHRYILYIRKHGTPGTELVEQLVNMPRTCIYYGRKMHIHKCYTLLVPISYVCAHPNTMQPRCAILTLMLFKQLASSF